MASTFTPFCFNLLQNSQYVCVGGGKVRRNKYKVHNICTIIIIILLLSGCKGTTFYRKSQYHYRGISNPTMMVSKQLQ